MVAVRDDEELARTLGLRSNFYKVLAFVLAAALASLTGSFFAIFFGSLAPGDFDIWASFNVLVWVLVGGVGTLLGPVIGVAFLWTIPQNLNWDPNVNLLIYGALLIAFVSFKRGGIMGLLCELRSYLARHFVRRGPAMSIKSAPSPAVQAEASGRAKVT
jgi:branched-chain amino acid transport system permease protein